MRADLRTDLMRASDEVRAAGGAGELGARSIARMVWFRMGLQALVTYRVGRWLATSARPISPAALLLRPAYALARAYVTLGLDIRLDPSAEIGAGLQIYHFGGIRVRDCRIGKDCVIHQEVHIEPDATGAPVVGDRVWVGPHARIVGKVHVADGATIAAGAVVKQDVPSDVIVAGNPARVIRVQYDNAELRNRI